MIRFKKEEETTEGTVSFKSLGHSQAFYLHGEYFIKTDQENALCVSKNYSVLQRIREFQEVTLVILEITDITAKVYQRKNYHENRNIK